MTKKEQEVEVTYYRAKEKELLESVGSLRKELEVMKAQIEELKRERMAFDPKKNVNKRTVDLERKMPELEQYSCRECVELIGLPEDNRGEELENSVVLAFEIAGVNVEKRDFHAIHRLGNSKIVIAKLVNRRYTIDGKIKIKYDSVDGECKTEISHAEDLVDISEQR